MRLCALGLVVALATPVWSQPAPGHLPDLSGLSTEAMGTPVATSAGGVFRSGLAVPSVRPGQTASAVAREMLADAGPSLQDGLRLLQPIMPQVLETIETEVASRGLASRDAGVAAGVAFVVLWGTARSEDLSDEASSAAIRTVGRAVAQTWSDYPTLTPDQQEATYEAMLVRPSLLAAFAQQAQDASETAQEASPRRAAAQSFRTLFGVDPSGVLIDADGRVSGLAPVPVAARPGSPAAPRPPAPPVAAAETTLPPVRADGVEVYLSYTAGVSALSGILEIEQHPLTLFPDGTAVQEYPEGPVAAFTPAAIRQAFPPEDRAESVGTWRKQGGALVLTFAGETRRLPRTPKGWHDVENDDLDGPSWDGYHVYLPASAIGAGQLSGPWEMEDLFLAGTPGSTLAPVVSGGRTGARVFYGDGTFSEVTRSGLRVVAPDWATGTYPTSRSNAGQASGRWRLDGSVLTIDRDGARTVLLAMLMPEYDDEDVAVWIGTDHWTRPSPDDD